ncbi:Chemotaxis response regulator protein-glutamate methylesterase [Aquisphaera giovannonii]|uniref:protein-glutamate methylesterase n=1 Tax=Aquisphaera giovannonii TaxID=406548 RepID=A0A5B9W3J6_9BACT|nr:chemotaxis protein CheB [Aquisphaera giovannonii]QEH34814.1 Chemotaxis response regulator protein-glutamate methylesterase [Aquisphaera giovannonii]
MARRDIIVVGASAGGVEALKELVAGLPAGFPASLFVVCHFPAGARSVLPRILSRSGSLLATHAADGEEFNPGQVYVAPPNFHMLLAPGSRIRLSRGARENHHRPAIDPLFRSAARHYGARVIALVLSGALHDGTAGLMAVRAAGGVSLVQDPADAVIASMPENAIRLARVDHVIKLAELAPRLVELVQRNDAPDQVAKAMDPIERMNEIAARDMLRQANDGRRGEVSVLTCPECGGTLWQVDEAGILRFRCHVGHAYNGELLLSEQSEALEAALWTAVRTFKEKWVLASQFANHQRAGGDFEVAARYDEQAKQAAEFGDLIERHLLVGSPTGGVPPDGSPGTRAKG